MKIVVSACLLGEACKYNGGSNLDEKLAERLSGEEVLPICPEVLAGAGIPRKCVELVDGRAVNSDGEDVDDLYRTGAQKALDQLLAFGAQCAVLKSRSPTCGVCEIYDGTFTGCLIPGSGIFAQMIRDAGIHVIDSDQWEEEL
ncbi:MAG: DUF523 domain-containing protein [Clostridia bacterium]